MAVAALMIAAPNNLNADIAANGGFETAGVGGATDSDMWGQFGTGVSERDSSNVASGSFAHRLFAEGSGMPGMGTAQNAVVSQNSIADVGLLSLQESTMLTASFDWAGNLGPGGVAFGVLRILNGTGAIVADTGLQSLANTGGTYTNVNLGPLVVPAFAPSPNDTYAAFLEISVASGAFDGSTAEGFVDNVVITGTVVPEPGTAALLGMGLLGLVGRRRR